MHLIQMGSIAFHGTKLDPQSLDLTTHSNSPGLWDGVSEIIFPLESVVA